MNKIVTYLLTAFLLLLLGNGCCTSKECQLESVAKDWCMTIRASQVIPVYPLTEDIQPGDIFLTQTTIDQQQSEYKNKGFLRLDHHVARLNPGGYTNFYGNSFLSAANGTVKLPAGWERPADTNLQAWQPAPHAGFPTYSFSVRHGEGINLAVPVDGVPVGLSLLNSDAASGAVTLDKAQTLGVDTISLWRELQTWAATNADFLSLFSGTNGEPNYLRVVSRIYVVGQVDVSLSDTSSQSGGLDVGAAKPVNLLVPQLSSNQTNTTATTTQNYTNASSVMQSLLTNIIQAVASNNVLPGGSLRLAGASSRTVALQETFNPPLVIGYLGFDCAIEDGGVLGPPIPTVSRLSKIPTTRTSYGSDPNTGILRRWLKADMHENEAKLVNFVTKQPNMGSFKSSDIPYLLNEQKYGILRQQSVIQFELTNQ
jgi:hypothetical protein